MAVDTKRQVQGYFCGSVTAKNLRHQTKETTYSRSANEGPYKCSADRIGSLKVAPRCAGEPGSPLGTYKEVSNRENYRPRPPDQTHWQELLAIGFGDLSICCLFWSCSAWPAAIYARFEGTSARARPIPKTTCQAKRESVGKSKRGPKRGKVHCKSLGDAPLEPARVEKVLYTTWHSPSRRRLMFGPDRPLPMAPEIVDVGKPNGLNRLDT